MGVPDNKRDRCCRATRRELSGQAQSSRGRQADSVMRRDWPSRVRCRSPGVERRPIVPNSRAPPLGRPRRASRGRDRWKNARHRSRRSPRGCRFHGRFGEGIAGRSGSDPTLTEVPGRFEHHLRSAVARKHLPYDARLTQRLAHRTETFVQPAPQVEAAIGTRLTEIVPTLPRKSISWTCFPSKATHSQLPALRARILRWCKARDDLEDARAY
jgi:hypothetical protein